MELSTIWMIIHRVVNGAYHQSNFVKLRASQNQTAVMKFI